jgi:Fe-S-cluster containining protein
VDRERINRLIKGGDIQEAEAVFFPYRLQLDGRCPFLRPDSCKIYGDRPVVCRLFPLALTFLPEGEMLVSLIRCDGVGFDKGRRVDEAYVREVLEDVERVDPRFLELLKAEKVSQHINLHPFLDHRAVTDFHSKRKALVRLGEWLSDEELRGLDIRARCYAALRLLDQLLAEETARATGPVRVRPPALLVEEEVDLILGWVADRFSPMLEEMVDRVRREVEELAQRALRERSGEIYWEGAVRRVRLEETLTFRDPFGNVGRVSARELVLPKPWSREAEEEALIFLREVLSRVDVGGFPIDTPLPTVLGALDEFSANLETYSRFYSQGADAVEVQHVWKAINDLDTSFLLAKLVRELTQP